MNEKNLRDFYRSTVTVAKNSYKLLRRKIRRIDNNKGKYALRKYYPEMHLEFDPKPDEKNFELSIMQKYEINDPNDCFFETFKVTFVKFRKAMPYSNTPKSCFTTSMRPYPQSKKMPSCKIQIRLTPNT